MPRPFATHYDLIYADKDYRRDIEVLAQLAAPICLGESDLLEIGAGTGNHTKELVRQARSVTSIEIDTDFADVFEEKMRRFPTANLQFERRPIAEMTARDFDISVALFHVLNYIGPAELPDFLSAVAGCLRPGGVFIADIWNGTAALLDPPKPENRRKHAHGKQVIQRIQPQFHPPDPRLRLDYTVEISDGTVSELFYEQLQLYLWSRDELDLAFRNADFTSTLFWDYREYPAMARPDSWRLWLKAEKTN